MVYGRGLENLRTERFPGFESLILLKGKAPEALRPGASLMLDSLVHP